MGLSSSGANEDEGWAFMGITVGWSFIACGSVKYIGNSNAKTLWQKLVIVSAIKSKY